MENGEGVVVEVGKEKERATGVNGPSLDWYRVQPVVALVRSSARTIMIWPLAVQIHHDS